MSDKLTEHHAYVREHGEDMPEVRKWVWQHQADEDADI
jgi:xylulose-5-phosphate/fructose-6-phosphate phosphoketolase